MGEAWERCKSTVPRSFVNSWKVWPVITALNFTFIAPQSRSAFAGCFAVVSRVGKVFVEDKFAD